MTVSTGLSDVHKMIVTVLKATFPKVKPKTLLYKDHSNFEEHNFCKELKEKLNVRANAYELFENIFLDVLNNHAPYEKKVVRANHKRYVTKKVVRANHKRYVTKKVVRANHKRYVTKKVVRANHKRYVTKK